MIIADDIKVIIYIYFKVSCEWSMREISISWKTFFSQQKNEKCSKMTRIFRFL